jgi:hypothetical protein
MVNKFGGGDFSRKLSEMNLDLDNPEELKGIAQNLMDGGFEITKRLTGNENITDMFRNISGVEGI